LLNASDFAHCFVPFILGGVIAKIEDLDVKNEAMRTFPPFENNMAVTVKAVAHACAGAKGINTFFAPATVRARKM
jgi:hypothetical protein